MNKTPIRYAGAKSKAIKHLSEFFPKDLNKVVSPFIGGGSFEVFLTNNNIEIIGYDIFKPLYILWDTILNNKEELCKRLSQIEPTKENFIKYKKILLSWEYTQEMFKDWKTDFYKKEPIFLTDIEVATFYFFSHNTSYGPAYLGWPSSVYLNDKSWKKTIKSIMDFDGKNIKIYNEDFVTSIPKHVNDFLYLDPPYYVGGEDNKMHGGIYPAKNFPIHHDNFNHEKLNSFLNKPSLNTFAVSNVYFLKNENF